MDMSAILSFIIPLVFALALLAGIASGARTRHGTHDRRNDQRTTYATDKRVRTDRP